MTRAERIVLDALIGQEPARANLYHHSAEFKAGVDLLARTIPRFMDLMVEESRESEVRRLAAIQKISMSPARAGHW